MERDRGGTRIYIYIYISFFFGGIKVKLSYWFAIHEKFNVIYKTWETYRENKWIVVEEEANGVQTTDMGHHNGYHYNGVITCSCKLNL